MSGPISIKITAMSDEDMLICLDKVREELIKRIEYCQNKKDSGQLWGDASSGKASSAIYQHELDEKGEYIKTNGKYVGRYIGTVAIEDFAYNTMTVEKKYEKTEEKDRGK